MDEEAKELLREVLAALRELKAAENATEMAVRRAASAEADRHFTSAVREGRLRGH